MITRKNEQTLSEVLDLLVSKYKLKPKLAEAGLISNWEKIMGKLVAKYTRQLYIKEGILYIEVTASPLREELMYRRREIVDLANEEMGGPYINDIAVY